MYSTRRFPMYIVFSNTPYGVWVVDPEWSFFLARSVTASLLDWEPCGSPSASRRFNGTLCLINVDTETPMLSLGEGRCPDMIETTERDRLALSHLLSSYLIWRIAQNLSHNITIQMAFHMHLHFILIQYGFDMDSGLVF